MATLLHYYAHPGDRFSKANRALQSASARVQGITRVDLYGEYPRGEINLDAEQERLRDHDVILLQFPLFWYAAPALMKDWFDRVWEHGFAYGDGGDALRGKWLMLAVTAGEPAEGYSAEGVQRHSLRTFLTPYEQTARVAQMRFAAPYVFHDALTGTPHPHAEGFARLLTAIRDDRYDFARAEAAEIITHDSLPITEETTA
ncbi:NAD(P)H-dependent oxidoreductase [Paracoccaceae bacterium GXU_MW_L88]